MSWSCYRNFNKRKTCIGVTTQPASSNYRVIITLGSLNVKHNGRVYYNEKRK